MVHPLRPIPSRDLVVGSRVLTVVLIALAALALVVNLTIGVKKILSPPALTLESPRNGELAYEPVVKVRGKTEAGTNLLLNGKTINISKDGKFEELITLQGGLNVIKISARKRYSRVREMTVRVLYESAKDFTFNKTIKHKNKKTRKHESTESKKVHVLVL